MLVIILPLIRFVRKKAEDERNKSLEKNPNKIQGKDVVSSVKVVTFVKYLPIVGIVWVNLCYIFANYYLYRITKENILFKIYFLLGVFCLCFMDIYL